MSSQLWDSVLLSLKVALISGLFTLPLALFFGYIFARKTFFGKTLLEGLFYLPLVLPPVTVGFLLLSLFGVQGWVGKPLFEIFGVRLAFELSAAILASMVVSFPLVLRSVRTAIEMVDPNLEEASLMLGKSKGETARRITLPLALPGIVAGVLLGFARSLGEFGATMIFAGNIAGKTQTIPLAIYSVMQVPGGESEAWILVFISIVLSMGALVFSEIYIKKRKRK